MGNGGYNRFHSFNRTTIVLVKNEASRNGFWAVISKRPWLFYQIITRTWTVQKRTYFSQNLIKTPSGNFKQVPEEFWGARDLVVFYDFCSDF